MVMLVTAEMLWQILAEFRLNLVMARRYWFNHVSSFVIDVLFFYALVVSVERLGVATGPNLAALLLTYMAFQVIAEISMFFAFNLSDGAKTGVLEHLALARGGLLRQILFRALGDTAYMLFRQVFVLLLLALGLGVGLRATPWLPLGLLPLVLASMGFGLAIGALALYFKEITAFFSILRFLLLPYVLSMLRFEPCMVHLPFAPGVQLLRLGLTGEPLPLDLMGLALLQGLLFLALGFGALAWVYRLVRHKGILGRY